MEQGYEANMRERSTGFTLIEMMVVVVIAAIMMGAVTLSFPSTKGEDIIKKEADRFVALLNFAQDEATLQSREFALSIDKSGYAFYLNDEGSWIEAEGAFSRNEYPDVIQSALYLEGEPIALGVKKKVKPQVLILSTGEMTPFGYRLSYLNEVSLTLDIDGGGLITRRADKKNEK